MFTKFHILNSNHKQRLSEKKHYILSCDCIPVPNDKTEIYILENKKICIITPIIKTINNDVLM